MLSATRYLGVARCVAWAAGFAALLAAPARGQEDPIFLADFESGFLSPWSFVTGGLWSTSAGFPEGGTVAAMHTCDGVNVSPAMSWTSPLAPAGWAVVMTDLDNGLVHWVIWDIASGASALPEDVDKLYAPADVPGAKQTLSYDGATRGYLGPCPPGVLHHYELQLYEVDTNPLPGLTTSTTRAQAVGAIEAHAVATTALAASYASP